MPRVANLVHQTATSTGTGNFTLAAVNGKQKFSTAFSTGSANTFDYFISNQDAAEWERGIAYMDSTAAMVRSEVIETSAGSTSAIDFTAGTKDVTNDVPAQSQVMVANIAGYGAVGDAVTIADAAITSSDNTLTSASNPFVSGDVGKTITVQGAGTAGAGLTTTIASFTNSGSVELTDAASTTVSGATAYFGTDNSSAIQDALDSGEEVIYVPDGVFLSTPLSIPATVKRIFGTGTLKATNPFSGGGHFIITETGITDCIIEGITIDVDPVVLGSKTAFYIFEGTRTKLSNVKIPNAGTIGVRISESVDCGVEHCQIEHFKAAGIWERNSSGSFARYNTIKAYAAEAPTAHMIMFGELNAAAGSTDIDITGNFIDAGGEGQFGINVQQTAHGVVANNRVLNCGLEALHASTGTSDIAFIGNVCDWPDFASGDYGISCHDDASGTDGTGTIIANNIVRRAGKSGIAILTGHNNGQIVGNQIIDCNQLEEATSGNGVSITNSSNWHISGNLAYSSDGKMLYGYAEHTGSPNNNTFTGNRSIGHATAAYSSMVGSGSSTFTGMKTGSYTGDGSTSKAITGLGFRPKHVEIFEGVADGTNPINYMTNDKLMAADAQGLAVRYFSAASSQITNLDNRIVSFDADGFTVSDDGTDLQPNKSGVTFYYTAWG